MLYYDRFTDRPIMEGASVYMRNIFFDICAVPIFALILWTCVIRRITKDHASRIFIMMNVVSLVCAILDIATELLLDPLPLSPARLFAAQCANYFYLVLRNSTIVLVLVFIFAITRTAYLIRPTHVRLLLWLPNCVMLVMVLQNPITHSVFTLTAESGYARGPAMTVIYIIAALYGVVGTIYCLYGKRYLPTGKWIALISIYLLSYTAVFIQFILPHYLVEMFSTALGLLMIMLLVMRPEETIDSGVGVQSWMAVSDRSEKHTALRPACADRGGQSDQRLRGARLSGRGSF